MSMQSERPARAVTSAASLSFVAQRADETLNLWPPAQAESYASASAEGQRRGAEFIALLRADGLACGLLMALCRDAGLPVPKGAERGYLAGFLFALEAELARPL